MAMQADLLHVLIGTMDFKEIEIWIVIVIY